MRVAPVPTTLETVVTTLFFGTWIVLASVSFILFYRSRDTALKRRWWPRFNLVGGVLFIVFSTTLLVLGSKTWWSLAVLFITVPAVALVSFLNQKMTKFCDKCGATLFNSNWFSLMRFCSKCGAELDPKPSDPIGDFE